MHRRNFLKFFGKGAVAGVAASVVGLPNVIFDEPAKAKLAGQVTSVKLDGVELANGVDGLWYDKNGCIYAGGSFVSSSALGVEKIAQYKGNSYLSNHP